MSHSNLIETNEPKILEKWAFVNGHRIYYRCAGEAHKKTVVLLHAIASDSSQWLLNISALAEHFYVIAPDMPGFGQSEKPRDDCTIHSLVHFILDFIKCMGIEQVSLIGHSLGAAVALHFALAYSTKVDRVVNVSGGYGYKLPAVKDNRQMGFLPGSLQLLNPTTQEQARKLLSLIIYDQQFSQSDEVVELLLTAARLSSKANQSLIEAFARREDTLDNQLNSLVQPMLIIWGQEDTLTPIALAERFRNDTPNSRLVTISQCAHTPYIEHAEQFNQEVVNFLTDA
ncbi:MAG: alpha/beta hydrolase [Cyanobacteria bacterium P01_A01_bin.114]